MISGTTTDPASYSEAARPPKPNSEIDTIVERATDGAPPISGRYDK